MRKLFSVLLIVGLVSFFFACEEDEDDNNGGTPTPSGATSMTAKVNGASWTAMAEGIGASLDSDGSLTIIAVGVAGTDTTLIALGTEAPQGGPFQLDTLSSNENSASANLFFVATSGEIAITAHNANTNTVSGTFNFVTGEFFGSPGYTVTEGVFNNVTYTE